MSSFTVCSFNVGTGPLSYYRTYNGYKQEKDPSLPKVECINFSDFDSSFLEKYEKVQLLTSKMLEGKAHVYCLQQASDLDRKILQFVNNGYFECINPDYGGTAIFLDKRRFGNISNFTYVNMENREVVARATATDIETGQRIAFISAEVPWMNCYTVKKDPPALVGLNHCIDIARTHKLLVEPRALTIMGADMNADPAKLSDRFDVFTKEGFNILRTNKATCVTADEPHYHEHDYFFVKTIAKKTYSFWESIKSLFFSSFDRYDSVISTEQMFEDFHPDQLASDHRPIFATFTPRYYVPLWRRCINWLF